MVALRIDTMTMSVKRIELTGKVAAEVATAADIAGYGDEAAYVGDLVRRDRAARDSLIELLRNAEAEGGDFTFDEIMADIQERRRSRAA